MRWYFFISMCLKVLPTMLFLVPSSNLSCQHPNNLLTNFNSAHILPHYWRVLIHWDQQMICCLFWFAKRVPVRDEKPLLLNWLINCQNSCPNCHPCKESYHGRSQCFSCLSSGNPKGFAFIISCKKGKSFTKRRNKKIIYNNK